jgi:cell division protein ZapA
VDDFQSGASHERLLEIDKGRAFMNSIEVEILGHRYSLKGVTDGDHVRRLASLVDARMKEIRKGARTSDDYRLAILAALNLADDLVRLRAQYEALTRTASHSVDRLLALTQDQDLPAVLTDIDSCEG